MRLIMKEGSTAPAGWLAALTLKGMSVSSGQDETGLCAIVFKKQDAHVVLFQHVASPKLTILSGLSEVQLKIVQEVIATGVAFVETPFSVQLADVEDKLTRQWESAGAPAHVTEIVLTKIAEALISGDPQQEEELLIEATDLLADWQRGARSAAVSA
ncbi:hypothetical protein [Ottowia sp.]|uniref:hypothetical protein n=1 Tax=Ottowia sp. TaxID=1898956 RepID=UPI0025F00172|nr:hypothetical protein [Ottowia sp.]MBK6616574.1 hypothetical protein [Ottowia sp.]